MAVMDIQEILELLPHRYPMLMVDKIVECDDEKRIVGIKNLTFNERGSKGAASNGGGTGKQNQAVNLGATNSSQKEHARHQR